MKELLFPIGQIKTLGPSLSVILLISTGVILSVFGYHYYHSIPLDKLTNDVTVAAEVPLYTGIQSQIGIFFWAATAAICLFSSRLVVELKLKNFLLVSAGITLLLGFDDIFLFHEIVFPSLGVHQKVVFLSYALAMLYYGLKYLKILLQTDYVLFALAIGFFGISLVVDNFLWDSDSELVTKLLEDGAKFVGIVCWFMYYSRTSFQMITTSKNSVIVN